MTADEKYMKEALRQARKAWALMEVPIGCVIVQNDKIIARGYNRRNTDKNTLSHAELNAILNNAHGNLKGARVYVTLFPCNECAKAIIQSGIAEIIYLSDKYHDSDISVASRFLLNKAGVRYTPYTPTGREVRLTL